METYLLYKISAITSENPASDFCAGLQRYDIFSNGNFNVDTSFSLTYQANPYQITHKQLPELECSCFVVETNRRCSLGILYRGFFQFIEDWIGRYDSEAWISIEYFTKDEVVLLQKNYSSRFMDKTRLIDFWSRNPEPNWQVLSVQYEEIQQSHSITTFQISALVETDSTEQLFLGWKAICMHRGWDDWDLVNQQFLPLTSEEAVTELAIFEQCYRLTSRLSKEGFQAYDAILRLANTDFDLCFLMKQGAKLDFLQHSLYTG